MKSKPTLEIRTDGTKVWKNNSHQFHRLTGPAVEYVNGAKMWYRNGKLHREDGPATICENGDRWWYKNGKHHREDGPAIENIDGNKSWWLNDKQLSEEEVIGRLEKKQLEKSVASVNKTTQKIKL